MEGVNIKQVCGGEDLFESNFGDIKLLNKTCKFGPVSKILIASVIQNWHKMHFLLHFLFDVSVNR